MYILTAVLSGSVKGLGARLQDSFLLTWLRSLQVTLNFLPAAFLPPPFLSLSKRLRHERTRVPATPLIVSSRGRFTATVGLMQGARESKIGGNSGRPAVLRSYFRRRVVGGAAPGSPNAPRGGAKIEEYSTRR